ncbi:MULTISPECIES: MFS transporter [Psychrobacter]|uniref:MFS transporter n=1 Tax=Psychrobacter TaxID=497 RepID=UPI00146E73A7|nr:MULTISPECIES: MFS transporter [Psychrobacter]
MTASLSAKQKTALPYLQLLAFTLAGFLVIMTETMPAGLLPQISAALGVSKALAGQLITLYALGSVLAAIPIIAATRSWNRRRLLLFAIGGLLIFNIITALSSHYGVILAVRFAAGMMAGVIWGLFPGYVMRLVKDGLQGRALAIAGVGQPIAFAVGVPLGTWLGGIFDWRGVFWVMSALTLMLFFWIRLFIPDFAGQSASQRLPLSKVAKIKGIWAILLTLLFWILAHNTLYTYIEPFLTLSGLEGRVDVVLLLFGVAALLGIWLTGLLVDNHPRQLTLVSLATFVLAALALGLFGDVKAVVFIAVALWGVTFGGAPIMLQTALADAARENTDVAQSMFVTIFNIAVGGGSLTGAILLNQFGAVSFPWAVLMLSVMAFMIVWSARRYGFRSR